jgi:DNA-binding LacI/PurR family transcriptional regulator
VPLGICAYNDDVAIAVVAACRTLGLRVPEDVAVIGFDDQPFSDLMALSSVRQPVDEQALDITTRLLALIAEDSDEAPSDATVVLPTELVVRGSTRA